MATLKFVDVNLTTGNNDGTTHEHAWRLLSQANGVAADTIVCIRPENVAASGKFYTDQDGATNAVLNSSTNGTITQPIIYQGDDWTNVDGIGNPAMVTIDASVDNIDIAVIPGVYSVYKYLKFTGGDTGGLYSSSIDNWIAYQCEAYSTVVGMRGDDYCNAINCKLYNGTQGYDGDSSNAIIGCEFYNNSTADINNLETSPLVYNNLFHEDNNVTCVSFDTTSAVRIIGNTFDGMGDGKGIDITDGTVAAWPIIINNCFYDLAVGIEATIDQAGGFAAIRNNLFNSNTADVNADDNIRIGEDVQTGAPAFVNEDVDYHPDTGSPLIDNALDAGSIGV